MKHDTWVRKHSPRKLSDLILPKDREFRRLVDEWRQERRVTLDGYVLHGSAGTGKTAFTKLLLEDMEVDSYAVLEQKKFGAKALDTIKGFAETERGLYGSNGDVCYIVCDGINQPTGTFIPGILRIFDELCSIRPIRFLFTTNNFNQLSKYDGFLSRFPNFSFDDLPKDDIEAHLRKILHKENAACSDAALSEIIAKNFPCVSAMINALPGKLQPADSSPSVRAAE